MYIVFGIVKNGGVKGYIFGAKNLKTFGEAESLKRSGMRRIVKVHLMQDTQSGDEVVGVEFVTKTFGGWSMTPATFTKKEAKKLAELLTDASF